MTLDFRRDLCTMLQALREVLAECDRQGVDSTGYHHFIEAFKVDQVRTPFALVLRHLEREARKHGDFRFLPLDEDCGASKQEDKHDMALSDTAKTIL